jgi:hypothetical protein
MKAGFIHILKGKNWQSERRMTHTQLTRINSKSVKTGPIRVIRVPSYPQIKKKPVIDWL